LFGADIAELRGALQNIICCLANKWFASGIWHTLIVAMRTAATRCIVIGGTIMSKTASLGLMPSASLFGRMMTAIDRLLMAHASIAIRNGDLPYPGL
jgi:hypothetical protein